jgi:hypothetical protein
MAHAVCASALSDAPNTCDGITKAEQASKAGPNIPARKDTVCFPFITKSSQKNFLYQDD